MCRSPPHREASLSGRDTLGFTPLHEAVRRFWEIAGESTQDRLARQAAVIRLLLQYGAAPLLLDGNGRTPVGEPFLAVALESRVNDAIDSAP
jgi:hypothetical protein